MTKRNPNIVIPTQDVSPPYKPILNFGSVNQDGDDFDSRFMRMFSKLE